MPTNSSDVNTAEMFLIQSFNSSMKFKNSFKQKDEQSILLLWDFLGVGIRVIQFDQS